MGLIKINLTEDIIKLLPFIRVDSYKDVVGVTTNPEENILGGTFVTESIAMILGRYDSDCIESTKSDWDGRKYKPEFIDYAFELYDYIRDNLVWIERIIHYYCLEGIKPGEYKCKDYEMLWKYTPAENKE